MPGMAPHNGIATALEHVLRETDDLPPGDDSEQLSLADFLGLPERPDGQPGNRHTGRPLGSKNRRTLEWIKFLESRYGNPLEILCQIAFARVDDLKAQLGCTALEALQEKRVAAAVAVPFFVKRQPIAVNFEQQKVVYLNIDMNPANGPADGPARNARDVFLHATLVPPTPTAPDESLASRPPEHAE